MTLTAGDVVAATGGVLIAGNAAQVVGPVTIDSRHVAAGDLFVAIRGDRFDGHAFVAEALEKGATGAIVQQPLSGAPPAGTPVLVRVDDTTRALQALAREVRRRSGAKVVAITGSAGKTTTKEVAADFLDTRYAVFRNKGNLNNHIGLPLSLLELRSRPEVAVVELGMNHPGEIRTLVGIAEPDVRVWTNVGDAHLGFFDSPDAIADAKAEILEHARPTDVLVANADDPRIAGRTKVFAGRVVTFGTGETATVRATNVNLRGLDGASADVRTPAGDVHIDTPLLGMGNLLNVLAATAVALQFDVPLATIVERAAALRPAYHRGELLRLPGGITLVDDSYNSSPAALKRTLETVQAARGSARKVAVLGEMLELGAHADALHEQCGGAAAAAGLNLLIAVGGAPARALADAAVRSGMPPDAVVHVGTKEEAADLALQRIRPGDLVLVKGSRGIGTDLVVTRLKAEFA
ncbi:MAG TPA: UDP-N-acetylmuramoyl-tripeptide--D-alanyl-D-alanine ligase [Vicinamibacterales bacterium]